MDDAGRTPCRTLSLRQPQLLALGSLTGCLFGLRAVLVGSVVLVSLMAFGLLVVDDRRPVVHRCALLVLAGVAAALVVSVRASSLTRDQQPGGLPIEEIGTVIGRVRRDSHGYGPVSVKLTEVVDLRELDRVATTRTIMVYGTQATLERGIGVSIRGRFSGGNGRPIRVDPRGIVVRPAAGLDALRIRVRDQIRRTGALIGGTGGALVRTLLLGDRSDLTAETALAFRRAGVAHVLALSGLHVGIASLTAAALLGAIRFDRAMSRRRRGVVVRWVVHLSLVGSYVLIAGGSPSLLRASAMLVFVAAGRSMDRDVRLIDGWSFAGVLALFVDPTAVEDLGFQLSYLAVLGIVLGAGPLARYTPRVVPAPLRNVLSVSISAQLAVMPLVAAAFGRLVLFGAFVSLVVTPLVAALIVIGGAVVVIEAAFGAPPQLLAVVRTIAGLIDAVIDLAQRGPVVMLP